MANRDELAFERVAVLAGMSASGREWLTTACSWHDRKAGSELLSYKDTSRDVFFLIVGRARVKIYGADGRSVVFHDLAAGEMFGELAAIDGGTRSASIEALEACRAASLKPEQFDLLLSREPSVARAVLRDLAGTVRRLSERVLEFSTLVVQNRIQAELLRLALTSGGGTRPVTVLTPAPTLADIAGRVATHREAVSRELSRLATLGIVRREASGLAILNVERLAALVREAKGE